MTIEQHHITTYQTLFVHRSDIHARQCADGSYVLRQEPVTARLLAAHLAGRTTVGLYPLRPDGTTRWAALDADGEQGLAQLQRAWAKLRERAVASYLERSRRGGHLWTFFAEPVTARAARRLMAAMITDGDKIELFPKQEGLQRGRGVGSLLRAPLGIHRLTGRRYGFVDPVSLAPVSDTVAGNIDYLARAHRLSAIQLADTLAWVLGEATRPPATVPAPVVQAGRRDGSLLARARERIGDPYTFIGQFTELDAAGRGPCPLHPPDRHPSFAVDRASGLWVCFHEYDHTRGRYLGGDAIALYMRLKDMSFQDALQAICSRNGIL